MSRKCEGLRGTELAICKKQHERINVLIKNTAEDWHKLLDRAYQSGALSEHFKQDNYLLPKAIVTVWCRDEPYAPLYSGDKKEVKNLERFI